MPTIYMLTDSNPLHQGSEWPEFFVSEEAAVSWLRNGKNISRLFGEWTKERHPSGDLIVRFDELTPKRRLPRYSFTWEISPVELHE